MIRLFHRIEETLLVFLLTSLTLLMFGEAIMRLCGVGALWLNDLVKWNAAWFVLFGLTYGLRIKAHIGLTIITSNIKNPILSKTIAIIALLICISYALIFLYSSYEYVSFQKSIGFPMEDLPIKQWIPYAGLLPCFTLILIRFLIVFFQVLFNKVKGLDFEDEAQGSINQFVQPKKKSK